MTDINPTPSWAAVRQLETNEYATGGLNGNMNEQAKSLAGQNMYSRLYAGLPFDPVFTAQVGGFPIGGKAALENGDIVRSTIPSNVNNPNENMTGWVLVNSDSQIKTWSGRTQESKNLDFVSVKDYGAIGDGAEHLLSEKFPSLTLAKVVYPFATSLDQQIDGCAIQAAINDSSTMGFVAYVPAGNYMHDGIVYSNKSKLRGSGSGSTILTCVNTSVQNTALVPDGSPSWFTEWELSGLTLTSKAKTAGQAGFKLDVCRGGLISDVIVQNMGMGWREKGCWNLTWFRLQVTNCLKIAEMETATYAGIPNYRYGLYCSNNTTGIEILEKGMSGTTFIGGGIERCVNYALKIVGAENRALKFIGFNFEDNNLETNSYDVIVGDSAITTSGVPNLSFDSCQFTCPSGATKTAFNLIRGQAFSIKNSAFNGGYVKGADISANFGSFDVENLSGLGNWCESNTSGVFIPAGRKISGTKASCVVTDVDGTITNWHLSTGFIIKSRRTTESYERFSLKGDGTLGWHAFNTSNPDVTLSRKDVKTLQTNAAFKVGSFSIGDRPNPSQTGEGAIIFNSTSGSSQVVSGGAWCGLGVRVGVPYSATASGAPGQFAADDSYFYVYTGDGTTHKWSRVPLTSW